MAELVLIAARARNQVIGRHNQLCWHLPEDLSRFRQLTRGQAVIMGRKTWESLPEAVRPLPGRQNIVVTRQASYHAQGAQVATSLDEALSLVERATAYVIGGEQLYRLALPLADTLEITEVDLAPAGDAFFPDFDTQVWRISVAEPFVSQSGIRGVFSRYERRPSPV